MKQRYSYHANLIWAGCLESSSVEAESLRALSKMLGLSVNTIIRILKEGDHCRTGKRVTIERRPQTHAALVESFQNHWSPGQHKIHQLPHQIALAQ